jgi:penicillin-binding protein 1A
VTVTTPGPKAKAKAKKPKRTVRQRISSWFRDASLKQWFKRGLLGGVAAVVILLVLLLLAYSSVSLPEEPESLQTTIVLDAEGKPLAELYKDENRVDVTLGQVADVMEKAVVAAEDRNFYEHSGLDPIGITRALVNDIRGKALQGGSTITQQLVKNTYLTSERSIVRKAREAVLAVKVEQQMSKREILERYLNTIYFGRGAHGIEKAAELYFGKKAADLQLHEAALLAGLIRAPESAEPIANEPEARRRRALVLNAMVRAGHLKDAEADAVKAQPLGVIERPDVNASLKGPSAYFVAMVRRWAVREFGERTTFGGGLRIETTLDPRMQAEADKAIRDVLNQPDDPQAALVTMREDGAVLAMIGGKDFQVEQTNLATNNLRPQAGSTYKPFVLAAALVEDVEIATRFTGPAKEKIPFEGFPDYEVSNYGGSSYGNIDLTQATANSVNTIYAKLASQVGLQRIAEVARDLGIDTDVPVVPSMSLGSANVSPYEMTRAYLTLANRGQRATPYYVKKVTDAAGNVLFEANPQREEAYPEEYADVMNHVLQQTITKGTGTAAAIGRPAAGKTGTTSDNADAWFVGYTPKYATSVWMGYTPGTERKMNSVHGRAVTGGSFPAQIWGRYMRAALDGIDTGKFAEPDDELLNARPDGDEQGGGQGDGSTTTSSSVPEESTTTTAPESESTTTTTDGSATTTTTRPPASSTTTSTTRPPAPSTTTTTAAAAASP